MYNTLVYLYTIVGSSIHRQAYTMTSAHNITGELGHIGSLPCWQGISSLESNPYSNITLAAKFVIPNTTEKVTAAYYQGLSESYHGIVHPFVNLTGKATIEGYDGEPIVAVCPIDMTLTLVTDNYVPCGTTAAFKFVNAGGDEDDTPVIHPNPTDSSSSCPLIEALPYDGVRRYLQRTIAGNITAALELSDSQYAKYDNTGASLINVSQVSTYSEHYRPFIFNAGDHNLKTDAPIFTWLTDSTSQYYELDDALNYTLEFVQKRLTINGITTHVFAMNYPSLEYTGPVQPITPIQPTDNPSSQTGSKDNGLSGGAIAGIVIACVAVVAGVITGVVFAIKKKE